MIRAYEDVSKFHPNSSEMEHFLHFLLHSLLFPGVLSLSILFGENINYYWIEHLVLRLDSAARVSFLAPPATAVSTANDWIGGLVATLINRVSATTIPLVGAGPVIWPALPLLLGCALNKQSLHTHIVIPDLFGSPPFFESESLPKLSKMTYRSPNAAHRIRLKLISYKFASRGR